MHSMVRACMASAIRAVMAAWSWPAIAATMPRPSPTCSCTDEPRIQPPLDVAERIPNWLNEGIAEWVGTQVIHQLEPSAAQGGTAEIHSEDWVARARLFRGRQHPGRAIRHRFGAGEISGGQGSAEVRPVRPRHQGRPVGSRCSAGFVRRVARRSRRRLRAGPRRARAGEVRPGVRPAGLPCRPQAHVDGRRAARTPEAQERSHAREHDQRPPGVVIECPRAEGVRHARPRSRP